MSMNDTRGGGAQPETPVDDAKQLAARLYSSVAAVYEGGAPFFAHAGRRLVDVAGVALGEAVLDVATGRGAALFPAVERVGRRGRVVGIDVAPGMVNETRAAIERRGIANAEIRLMDAEALALDAGSFDRVLCSFAVFWFPNLDRALAEMRRVLRPGGTLAFAFTRGADPRWTWYADRLREMGALDGLPPPPGRPGIRQPNALATALREAGFADPGETVEEAELYYPDAEAWWSALWTHGDRVSLERLSPGQVERLKADCLPLAQALAGPHGIPQRHTFI
jgi:ubiquinone/menaquinone biosynthesis C-methylase UbiE